MTAIPDPMPYIHEPGDLGEFGLVEAGRDANGAPYYCRQMTRQAKYTGGKNVDGSWTRAEGWENYQPREVLP